MSSLTSQWTSNEGFQALLLCTAQVYYGYVLLHLFKLVNNLNIKREHIFPYLLNLQNKTQPTQMK